MQRTLAISIELHEHQIPDLDVPVEIVIRAARRTARHIGPMVVENFRTGATGAGITHLPEIVFIEPRQAVGVDTDIIDPNICSFVVANVYCDPQPLLGQPKDLSQKTPAKADGVAFEVIAETEVTQHFKEGVVPSGITHIFEIVVFTASTDTFLGSARTRIGTLLKTQKRLLKLVHPRVGEQKGGIVVGN